MRDIFSGVPPLITSTTPISGLDQVRLLFAYHAWTRPRVVAALRAAPGFGEETVLSGLVEGGSLRGLAVHVFDTQDHWLRRMHGDARSGIGAFAAVRTVDEIAAAWEASDAALREYLAGLTEEAFRGTLGFYRGEPEHWEEQLLWQVLLHLSNHTTHHRAELCAALTLASSPPESVDMIDFLREGAPGTRARHSAGDP